MLIPKAKKERRRNPSITGLPLLTHRPSCTDRIPVGDRSGGTRPEEKRSEKDGHGHLHERGPRAGREAEEGLGPGPNKAGLNSENGPGAGDPRGTPFPGGVKAKRCGSQRAAWTRRAPDLGDCRGALGGPLRPRGPPAPTWGW